MVGFDNPVHIVFVLVVVLLVLGAKRLPEIGRSLGSGLRGFKDSLNAEPARPPALQPPSHADVAEPSAVAAPANETRT